MRCEKVHFFTTPPFLHFFNKKTLPIFHFLQKYPHFPLFFTKIPPFSTFLQKNTPHFPFLIKKHPHYISCLRACTINLFVKTAINILLISSYNSFRVLFDEIASVYLIWKYIYILAVESASLRNRHCADCIGTLSFPIQTAMYHVLTVTESTSRTINFS